MIRTARITQTKTKGFTIRLARGSAQQQTLVDAVETVRISGMPFIRFRALNGRSKLFDAETIGVSGAMLELALLPFKKRDH